MVALGRQEEQKFRVIFCSYISDRQIEANMSYRRPLLQKNKTQNKNKTPKFLEGTSEVCKGHCRMLGALRPVNSEGRGFLRPPSCAKQLHSEPVYVLVSWVLPS